MIDDFYRAFEDRYRGPRDLIKTRLRVYLPFIEPLKTCYADAPTIDLGCGRGEWLELLQENDFRPAGVDLDDGMLESCRELGLPAEHGDAIEALKSLADESQIVVSGFHIVEHLPFGVLQTLVQEALRVLKPGGLLIMETPNPENLTVGTCNFYYDPSHLHPIPPPLLGFLPEYYGFKNVKTIRLQESAHLQLEQSITLHEVLAGVSPDFAIIAQKEADESIISATSGAFKKEYGISIEMLASRYDKQSESRILQAEAKAQQAEAALNAFYSSSSWRITAPLRWAVVRLRRTVVHIRAMPTRVKVLIRLFLTHAQFYVQARPRLRKAIVAMINRFPALKQRIKRMTLGNTNSQSSQSIPTLPAEFDDLTPRARRIYTDLKAAIEKNKEVR
jgi:SAM-dependent methyltransferase